MTTEPRGRRPSQAPSRRGRALLLAGIAGSLVALVALTAALPVARAAARTLVLMPSFFDIGPLDALAGAVTPIRHEDVSLGGGYPAATLHIYRPASGRHAALVISLGAEPAPPDDPRVVALLSGLAHAGIVAVLVQSPDLDAGRIEPDAPDLLVNAFGAVQRDPSVDPAHVGFLGLSVGGSLALLAAADPRVAARVRLVEAFGAYGSLEDLACAAITRRICAGAGGQAWGPNPLTVDLVRSNMTSIAGSDASTLLGAADPAQFEAAAAALPANERAELEALSPDSVLARIQAPVFLMVDRSDPYIPYTESFQIARGLQQAGHPAYFSPFDIFRHVEPAHFGSPLALARDLLRLFWHVTSVLQRL